MFQKVQQQVYQQVWFIGQDLTGVVNKMISCWHWSAWDSDEILAFSWSLCGPTDFALLNFLLFYLFYHRYSQKGQQKNLHSQKRSTRFFIPKKIVQQNSSCTPIPDLFPDAQLIQSDMPYT